MNRCAVGTRDYDLTTPGVVYWALTDKLGTVRDLAVYDFGAVATSIVNHIVYDKKAPPVVLKILAEVLLGVTDYFPQMATNSLEFR